MNKFKYELQDKEKGGKRGDLTTGFRSLRRDGLSRSNLRKEFISPDCAKPWIVVGFEDLGR